MLSVTGRRRFIGEREIDYQHFVSTGVSLLRLHLWSCVASSLPSGLSQHVLRSPVFVFQLCIVTINQMIYNLSFRAMLLRLSLRNI